MQEKKAKRLEQLQTKHKQLSARIAAEQAKTRAKEKKARVALLFAWGEVVEAALKNENLITADWQALCALHLPEGYRRKFAIDGAAKYLPSGEAEKTVTV